MSTGLFRGLSMAKKFNHKVNEGYGDEEIPYQYVDEYREHKAKKRLKNALRARNINDIEELMEDDWL